MQKARVETGKLKVGAKAKAEKQGGGGTATIEAKHRGGGSYSVIGLRTELVEKLDKEGAEKFNALDDGGKAAFVEANKTAE